MKGHIIWVVQFEERRTESIKRKCQRNTVTEMHVIEEKNEQTTFCTPKGPAKSINTEH